VLLLHKLRNIPGIFLEYSWLRKVGKIPNEKMKNAVFLKETIVWFSVYEFEACRC